jgi:hypothetical protein
VGAPPGLGHRGWVPGGEGPLRTQILDHYRVKSRTRPPVTSPGTLRPGSAFIPAFFARVTVDRAADVARPVSGAPELEVRRDGL